MLPRMNGGKAPMAIYSGFTGNHAILAIGTARARQPRALDLNGGFSMNRTLAIGLLYDRTWSAVAGTEYHIVGLSCRSAPRLGMSGYADFGHSWKEGRRYRHAPLQQRGDQHAS